MKESIKYIYIISLTALFLSACSSDNGSSSGEGSTPTRTTNISLKGTACVASPSATNIDEYMTLQSDDKIIKDEANTTVEIYHDANGLKKVCLVSGLAHVVR